MNAKLYSIFFITLMLLFHGCDDGAVDVNVISQGAKMSLKELEKIDNIDKESYVEIADIALDNRTIDPSGRYLMMIFGSNGCIYCDRLKQDIKNSHEVKDYIKGNFSLYYINGSYSKPHTLVIAEQKTRMMTNELVQLYGVRPTPTIIFATPQGKTILTYPGYLSKERLEATLHFITERIWEGASDEREVLRRLTTFYKEKSL